jgi:hypothetical protein
LEVQMLGAYVSPQKLERLRVLAGARGQSLNECLDDLIATGERQGGSISPQPVTRAACPLVDLVCEYVLRLCRTDQEPLRVARALRAAAIDGEHSHVGPLDRDGLMLELSPQWEGVRIIVGEGRFTLNDAAALQLADRLATRRWRATLVA